MIKLTVTLHLPDEHSDARDLRIDLLDLQLRHLGVVMVFPVYRFMTVLALAFPWGCPGIVNFRIMRRIPALLHRQIPVQAP